MLGARNRGFELTRLLALQTRRPIDFPQAVENRAANAELRVGFQLDVLPGVEIVDRIDEPNHSGGQQIFEADGIRHALMDLARDQTHLRHMRQNQLLPLLFGNGVGRIVISDCRQLVPFP